MILIIKKDIKLIIIRLIPIITYILIVIYMFVFESKLSDKTFSNLYFSIPMVGVIIAILGAIYTNFFFDTFVIIGEIIFKSDYILIFDKKIYLTNINSVKIVYKSVYGQATGGLTIAKGDNNKIEIKCKNGDIYLYTFLLKTNRDLSNLEKHMEYYKKNYKDIELDC